MSTENKEGFDPGNYIFTSEQLGDALVNPPKRQNLEDDSLPVFLERDFVYLDPGKPNSKIIFVSGSQRPTHKYFYQRK